MDVAAIVKKYLEEHGFDGLYDEYGECGCEKDNLFPCDSPTPTCAAGYKVSCHCGENCDWHMSPKTESQLDAEFGKPGESDGN